MEKKKNIREASLIVISGITGIFMSKIYDKVMGLNNYYSQLSVLIVATCLVFLLLWVSFSFLPS